MDTSMLAFPKPKDKKKVKKDTKCIKNEKNTRKNRKSCSKKEEFCIMPKSNLYSTTRFNGSEREELLKRLQEEGHEVIDTIFAEESPKDCDTAIYYLAKSIETIGKVDIVVFMPGWEKARGCVIEHQVAVSYDKVTMYCN